MQSANCAGMENFVRGIWRSCFEDYVTSGTAFLLQGAAKVHTLNAWKCEAGRYLSYFKRGQDSLLKQSSPIWPETAKIYCQIQIFDSRLSSFSSLTRLILFQTLRSQ